MSAVVKVPGVRVVLGGREWVIPPLTLAALEQMQDRLEGFTGGLDRASVALIIDAAHAALLRNYPELARDDVSAMIDVANMNDVMQSVMDVSGIRRKEQEAAPGEPQPGQ